jgi:hypothetical protein
MIMTKLEENGLNGTSKPRAEIICDGDSWVFGSEIVDPEIVAQHPPGTYVGYFDFEQANDAFRRPRVFSHHLQKYFDADITNLSWPADDNGSILRRTIDYISNKYLKNNLSTENLFVMIGWSSPERNSFWYKDENISMLFRVWPNVPHFDSKEQEKFWEMYIAYLWHPEEYMTRYVLNVIQLQNFCNNHGIKWMCFNSFYQTPKAIHAANWEDLDVRTELQNLVGRNHGYQYQSTTNPDSRDNMVFDYTALWDSVDPIRFYRKDQPKNTFKSYIQQPELGIDPVFWGWHPSPDAHEAWAEELARYIKDNKLI